MPIYAYRCGACGHAKDVLQKLSDPVLTVCPACGAEAFSKQVTAAGFQLKGSGWYVTDFRDGNKGAAAKPDEQKAPDAAKPADGAKPAEGGAAPAAAPAAAAAGRAPAAAPAASPAAAPAASPAPAGGSGG